ncbi:acyl carrier protein [uncultured Phascolarctobacterium sp.]|uniref:acyl carrier protein n=1 Tax=Phascolarctobacterium sp. TaxID=2049039 RepID=UPI0025FC3E76|nr:acyl carrier protein [uncultured Phascolarctobacterium sp.]
MEKLYTLLEEIRPDVDFRSITTLVTDGFIDSFDIVTIIASIEDEFAVEIPVDSMVPENFESAAAVMELINGAKK